MLEQEVLTDGALSPGLKSMDFKGQEQFKYFEQKATWSGCTLGPQRIDWRRAGAEEAESPLEEAAAGAPRVGMMKAYSQDCGVGEK